MARPRKSDAVISGIVEHFAKQLAGALSTFIRVHGDGAARNGRKAPRRGTRRARVLCYFPGCKNLAAPRFGMFCASEHKNLSKADKDKYRAQHSRKAVAANRARKK